MRRTKEDKCSLSDMIQENLMVFGDFNVVAEDLKNMFPGQICDVSGTVANLDYDKERIERYKSDLIEALGDRRENYELTIVFEDDKTIGNICFERYATLRVTRKRT